MKKLTKLFWALPIGWVMAFLFSLLLFYSGVSRLSNGIFPLTVYGRLPDQELWSYAHTGDLYIKIGLLLAVSSAVVITYTVTKAFNKKKR